MTEETTGLGAIARAHYDTLSRSRHPPHVGNGVVGRGLFVDTGVEKDSCII